MARILIVDDEPQMRLGLQDNLEFEGFEVDSAEDGPSGLKKIEAERYDLIVLDVMMPGMSGFDVCRKARALGVRTPIIMLTAKGEEIDKVLGLELGADDYITKPFGLRELLARIKAVLRRVDGDGGGGAQIRVGNLEVDLDTYTARSEGRDVSLSHKEFEIVRHLWQHRGETVSRDQLLNDVWGYDEYPTTRTVDNFIVKLRKKLEPVPEKPRHILTVYGVGYKLVP